MAIETWEGNPSRFLPESRAAEPLATEARQYAYHGKPGTIANFSASVSEIGLRLPSLEILTEQQTPELAFRTHRSAREDLDRNEQYFARLHKPSTEITFSRNELIRRGIDPNGTCITIGVYEPFFAVSAPGNDHGTLVSGIILDFIPQAPLQMFRPDAIGSIDRWRNLLRDYRNQPNGLDQFISDSACGALNQMSDELLRIFDPKTADPSMRVFNMSLGFSRVTIYESIMQAFQREPEKYRDMIVSLLGEERARQWINLMRSQSQSLTNANSQQPESRERDQFQRPQQRPGNEIDLASQLRVALMQAIVNRVDQQLDRNPLVVQALQHYQDITRRLAERGIILVVSACNDGGFASRWGVKVQPGAEYNFLAQSNYVVSVGASNSNHTSGRPKDDFPASFSSSGGALFRPTLLAPGEAVPLGVSSSGSFDGTSCAAPHVSATIALMLEQNPNLTFQNVVNILQRNCYSLPGVSANVQGAGVLSMHQAIIAARASRH